MPTTFHIPRNNVGATVVAPRAAGAVALDVTDGSAFGNTFPLIATAIRGSAVLAILEVTGRTGNTLTVSGAIEGTTDAALLAGDRIEMRPTALALTEVHEAVHALETAVETTVTTEGSYADPAWLTSLSGAKVSGDIAGGAGSITGSITTAQVTGLDAALAAKLVAGSNLADLADAQAARTNLGLGTAATHADGDYAHSSGDEVIGGDKTLAGITRFGNEFGARLLAAGGSGAGIWLWFSDNNMYIDAVNGVYFRLLDGSGNIRLTPFVIDSSGKLSGDGSGLTNLSLPNGGATLLSDHDISTSGVWEDVGLSVELPAAGTYLLSANVRSFISVGGGGGFLTYRLYDATAAAPLGASERMGILDTPGTGRALQQESAFTFLYTNVAPCTIKLQVMRTDGDGTTTWAVSRANSDSNGWARLDYVRVG